MRRMSVMGCKEVREIGSGDAAQGRLDPHRARRPHHHNYNKIHWSKRQFII